MVIGLTGGIGCGKTTVLRVFESLGVPCFIADEDAKRCYEQESFLENLRLVFGEDVFTADGGVDKKMLAQKVFSDTDNLRRLNEMIHPQVRKNFEEWCKKHSESSVLLLESAILYESGFDSMVDCVVTVYLNKDERLKRLMQRDNTTREQLLQRMGNQMPDEEKLSRADYVILNYEGNPRRRQVEYILSKINGKLTIVS